MFKGIEGARAWLAWVVVFSHVAFISGLAALSSPAMRLSRLGEVAVEVFIIISGFVITHLILTKREPFGLYISRRALRIFPAYLICLALAIAVAPLSYIALIDYPYTIAGQKAHFLVQASQYHSNILPHIFAHITLLHGAVPDQILPGAEYMFLPAAWSISLEWQFYLIAPIWLWLFRKSPLAAISMGFIGVVIYNHYLASGFFNPSFLPGSALGFLIGMSTRIYISKIPRFTSYPWVLVLGSCGLLFMSLECLPLVLWVALVAYFQQEQTWATLDGRLARAAGARSFSVYLVHLPLLYASAFFAIRILHFTRWSTVLVIGAFTIVGTALASEALYRFAEKPAIDFARSLAFGRLPINTQVETGR